ncbi:MAG: MBL fold metallo-hydrolase [Candidatus Thorarchaeota archaeon]|nr:MAG: MBL fold metallo-hydrolase [Candidatus Thorarchaeota archaeon]
MTIEQYLSQIDQGVILLTPPRQRFLQWRRSANIVIIDGSSGVTVIDSGGTSLGGLLTTTMKRLYGNKDSQVYCQHTHGHIDHIAGSSRIVKDLGGSIYASRDAVPYVLEQTPINMNRERPHMVVSFRELFSAPAWFVNGVIRLSMGKGRQLSDIHLLEDDPDPGETGFRPIPLPGHHIGHTGFFNDESGVLVAGDLIDPRHKMKPVLTSPSSKWSEMKNALETVVALQPKTIIPGHGDPIVGRAEVSSSVQRAVKTLDDSMDYVTEFIDSRPACLHDLSQSMIGMGIGPGTVFRNMFIHSILAELLRECRVSSHDEGRNKTVFTGS